MKIKIDTREQRPYSFTSPSETGTLAIGDYSIVGLEDHIAIERKSLDDLIGCLTHDRNRFERELHKGRALDYFALVIEGSFSDLAKGRYHSQALPKAVIQSLMAFTVRYRLPIFFCDTRSYAQRVVESLLEKYVHELEKKIQVIEKAA